MDTAVKKETDYQQVYLTEGFGSKTKFKLKLFMDIGRDYTDADKSNICDCVEKLKKLIMKETFRLNPEYASQAKEERIEFLKLFEGRDIFVEEIPNGYWGADDAYGANFPWYVITTKIGRIKIGWRKRVINIDWSETTNKKTAKELFPEEDVTKYDQDIHAWGYKKAQEYINKILS